QRLGVGAPQVFEALRGELLAKRLREMALGGMQVTPAQRWDYYRRQKQHATVEAVAIPVEDFIGEVADPPDEELQAFFDAHKDQEPNPESPVPGFKVPKKAAFEVVIAKFDDFLDPQSVTEEEVKEHYEKLKDTRYLWNESKFGDESDEAEPAKDESATREPAKDQQPSETSEEKPANETPDDGKDTEKKAGEAEKGAPDKSAPAKAADPDKTEGGAKQGEKRSSVDGGRVIASLLARPTAALVGLLAADDADPADSEKPAEPGTPPSEKTPAGQKTPADKTKTAVPK